MTATSLAPPQLRLFVAIYPVRRVLGELRQIQRALQALDSQGWVRWSRPAQLHLTLAFLGNMQAEHVESIGVAIQKVAIRTVPFRLKVEKLGCFPSCSRPSIIWAGAQGDREGLQSLKQRLDAALRFTGFHQEKRPFHPHITLGRLRSEDLGYLKKMGREIQAFAEREMGEWMVNHVKLVYSSLSPHGSRYRVLAGFPFSGRGVS